MEKGQASAQSWVFRGAPMLTKQSVNQVINLNKKFPHPLRRGDFMYSQAGNLHFNAVAPVLQLQLPILAQPRYLNKKSNQAFSLDWILFD